MTRSTDTVDPARRVPATGGDEGVALLYALVFTTVIALVLTALLAQSSVQFKAADAYRHRRDAEFAADAGLEHALSTIGLFASAAGPGAATCVDVTKCPVTPVPDSLLEFHKEASGVSPVIVTGLHLTRGAGTNRLVVVTTGATTRAGASAVTFNNVDMHRAGLQAALGCPVGCSETETEVWYLLDAELPAAAGFYNVRVTSGGSIPYAVHASAWAGILQDFGGAAYVPTWAGTSTSASKVDRISTTIPVTANSTLLFSAVTHGDDDSSATKCTDDGIGLPVAALQVTNGPNPNCQAGVGTSYAIRTTGSQTMTETFLVQSKINSQVVVAFLPAMSVVPGPPVFGATCTGTPIHLTGVDGYTVDVVCTMTSADTLTIVSTATDGTRTELGRAVLTRRAIDGRVDVTSWDIRPDAK